MKAPAARASAASPPRGQRIQVVLARAGLASRREAERWLAEGRISVNGAVVRRPGTRVDPSRDHVKVDGRGIAPPRRHVYYLLHKPVGYVTSTRDPEGRPVVMDLLRGLRGRVFPLGRLDYHTSGLLLLTNDGDLADRLLRPATGCPKVYHARVRGTPPPEVLSRLARGIVLEGRRTLPCRVRLLPGREATWVEVVLKEGRRNQIRNMFRSVGHPVSRLRRVAIGPLKDPSLGPGDYRALTEAELNRLRDAIG